MNIRKNQQYILASLFTALICIITVLIAIPIPGGNGYINLSDTFCILSVLILGPALGSFATGIGCLFADVILGYYIYIPATVILKILGIIAIHLIAGKNAKPLKSIIACCIYTVIVTAGYFIYEYFIIGINKLAVVNLPYNIIQMAVCSFLSIIIFKSVNKIKKKKEDGNE